MLSVWAGVCSQLWIALPTLRENRCTVSGVADSACVRLSVKPGMIVSSSVRSSSVQRLLTPLQGRPMSYGVIALQTTAC